MATRTIVIRRSPKWWLRQRFYSAILAENGEETFRSSELYRDKNKCADEANRTAGAAFAVRDET